MHIKTVLQELGLSNNEIEVYLATLKIGSAKNNRIAKQTTLLRTTTYEVLKSLLKKGLVSYVIKSGVKHFEAADPDKLLQIQQEKANKLKHILPHLHELKHSVTQKPSIELYEGKEGLKTILDDIIKSRPQQILTLSSAKIFQTLNIYFPHWINRRINTGIYAKVLQECKEPIKTLQKKDECTLREIRFLPKNFKINTHTQIYADKIATLTLKKDELIGVLIKNKDIAQTQTSIFNSLWASYPS